MNIDELGKIFNEWFQIFKRQDPKAEDSDAYWEGVFDDLCMWSQKYEGIEEAGRWLVVQLVNLLMFYEAYKLRGVKDKRELNFRQAIEKRLRNADL